MGVLAEALSVVIPVTVLDDKYPGGVDGYRSNSPNATFCTDGHLTRIGFMTPPDVKAFVDELKAVGLSFHNGTEFTDIAIVDQNIGPTSACRWLKAGRHPLGFAVAWLDGTSPSPMAAPTGWTIDQSAQLTFVPNEDAQSRTFHLARKGNTDILLDFATGKEIYVGRTTKDEGLTLGDSGA